MGSKGYFIIRNSWGASWPAWTSGSNRTINETDTGLGVTKQAAIQYIQSKTGLTISSWLEGHTYMPFTDWTLTASNYLNNTSKTPINAIWVSIM
jgi:hypothetical protein